MQSPALPPNESSRLASLRRMDLLDTPPEEQFDRITRLALQVFGVPIALIFLVDSERQWFKSRQGVDIPEAPRAVSFCGRAILQEEVFEIPDALADWRFHDNPLMTGPPAIRFYAGAPLGTLDGYRVGTLCIIDRQPPHLSLQERQVLRDMANVVQEDFNRGEIRQSVGAIREQEGRLRASMDTVAEGIITFDEAGIIEDFNPAAARVGAGNRGGNRRHAQGRDQRPRQAVCEPNESVRPPAAHRHRPRYFGSQGDRTHEERVRLHRQP